MRIFYTTDIPINGTLNSYNSLKELKTIINDLIAAKRKSPRITAYERIKTVYKYISAQAFSSPILTDGRNTFASVISAPSLR